MKLEGLNSCVLSNWPERLFFIATRRREIQMVEELVSYELLHRGLPIFIVPTSPPNLVVRVWETSRRGPWEWVFSRPWFSKDGVYVKNSHYNKGFRIPFTADVKLYHRTKFSLYLSFTVYYFYTGISCFMLCSSSRLILDNFFLLIPNLRNYQLASHVCRLP